QMRRVGIALLLIAVTGLGACSGASSNAANGKTLQGSFERLDGGRSDLATYRGKPTVVNFFSSTCVPCQTEMPALERAHQQLGDKVSFVGMDVQDTVEGGKSFVDATEVTYDVGRDPNGAILQDLDGVLMLPTTAIADANGKIVWLHTGALNSTDI